MSLFKDFTKNLGGIIGDAALNGLVQGIRSSEFINRYGGAFEEGNKGYIEDGLNDDSQYKIEDNKEIEATEDQFTNASKIKLNKIDLNLSENVGKKFYNKANILPLPYEQTRSYVDDEDAKEYSDIYKLRLPQWGYADFINERNMFIKNFTNGFGDPGWMYFKIFFNFNTQHGLFGGILNNAAYESATNSAYRYLWECGVTRYKSAKLKDRLKALHKFTNYLSYINCNSPWFFKSIKNLNNVGNPYISEFTSDNKYFELELAEDAIDMRISTLFSLYKFACYDDINCREIIPDNLRKFDMCVVVFLSPVKLQHTPVEGSGATLENYARYKYKKLFDNNLDNLMSFKLYNFINCEFDRNTLGGTTPSELTNENPFQLGKNIIKINYDRVYDYTHNEFTGDLFGSDAYYATGSEKITVSQSYSNFVTASENFINSNIANLLGKHQNYALGNLFLQDRQLYKEYSYKSIDKSEGNGSKFLTDFAKSKFGIMKGNSNFIASLGYDILYKWLGSSYRYGSAPGIDGSGSVLSGDGQLGVGSAVWNDKMERLKFGPKGLSYREARLGAEYGATNFDLQKYIKNKALKNVKSII